MRPCLVRYRCWATFCRPRTIPPRAGGVQSSPVLRADPNAAHRHSHANFTSRSGTVGKRRNVKSVPHEHLNEPDAWLERLDRKLPKHLRADGNDGEQAENDADDIADIVVSAQRLSESGTGVDILFHLGVKQDRWRAVVWLVKHMVETPSTPPLSVSDTSSAILGLWTSPKSLHELTSTRGASDQSWEPQSIGSASRSLDEITGDAGPATIAENQARRHDVLGSIWRSLGLMAIDGPGSEMRPELLEIIAYLHHMEIMPVSIYNQKHAADATAVQQPPMLKLFSTTILTSLSDAAWRAHEKSTIEEARAKSGPASSVQSGIPGNAVRMNTPGLRSEVWIELILWSCLHGGWILEGAAILRAIYSESSGPRWRPLSWTSVFRTSDQREDWDKLTHLFNGQNLRGDGRSHEAAASVRRTISSEVVNGYVDALFTTIRSGVGERGAAPKTVLLYLSTLHKLLQRAGLGLHNGSWDAVVLRYLDSQDTVIDQGGNFHTLLSLSPGLGEGLAAMNQDNLPQYVLEGSAATLGMFHRALGSRVSRGDLQGALGLFERLQDLANRNKRRSLVDFFNKPRLSTRDGNQSSQEMFTSNFPGIEYPVFHVQVPASVLGPFLDLITDGKAYDWGRWLIYGDDGLNEPVVSERLYDHPAVGPALVRFASSTHDTALLRKALQASERSRDGEWTPLSEHVLQALIETQVKLTRWDSAERVLRRENWMRLHSENSDLVAHVIRAMLFHVSGTDAGNQTSERKLARAKEFLRDIIQGEYDGRAESSQKAKDRVTMLLVLLSMLNRSWSDYCFGVRPLQGILDCGITVKQFNWILEGAVYAYGSVVGRRLLNACRVGAAHDAFESGERVMPRSAPSILQSAHRQRTVIPLPGHPDEKVVIYGGIQPNMTTMGILNAATGEAESQSTHEAVMGSEGAAIEARAG